MIGVVTSPTGAVIRDILHRLADRFPRPVLVWPVRVQGEGAAEEVAAAIAGFNRLEARGAVPRPELLIVARGGGSLEDLWAFNEEAVVRAAAASAIPLISAIGHETDTTLIDLAADVRAPTPTAAAEYAVPVRAELLAQVLDDARRLVAASARMIAERRTTLVGLARGIADPGRVLEAPAQRLDFAGDNLRRLGARAIERRQDALGRIDARLMRPAHLIALARAQLDAAVARLRAADLVARMARAGEAIGGHGRALARALEGRLGEAGHRLGRAVGLLESLSYQRVLERGFALVRDRDAQPITSVAAAVPGTVVAIRFHDGEAPALVTDSAGAAPARPRARRTRRTGEEPQGTLL